MSSATGDCRTPTRPASPDSAPGSRSATASARASAAASASGRAANRPARSCRRGATRAPTRRERPKPFYRLEAVFDTLSRDPRRRSSACGRDPWGNRTSGREKKSGGAGEEPRRATSPCRRACPGRPRATRMPSGRASSAAAFGRAIAAALGPHGREPLTGLMMGPSESLPARAVSFPALAAGWRALVSCPRQPPSMPCVSAHVSCHSASNGDWGFGRHAQPRCELGADAGPDAPQGLVGRRPAGRIPDIPGGALNPMTPGDPKERAARDRQWSV